MITIEPPSITGAVPSFMLSKSGLARFLNRARAALGLEGEVHVLLADDATLKGLNRTYRGKNKATDVLSFPAADSGVGVAGDLAISLETAARQAARFGHTLRDEVRVLMLHGVLHLAGFDHEADDGEMAAREAELRRELGLPAGLIGRVGPNATNAIQDKNKRRRNTGVLRCAQDDELQRDDLQNGNGRKRPGKGVVRRRVRA